MLSTLSTIAYIATLHMLGLLIEKYKVDARNAFHLGSLAIMPFAAFAVFLSK